MITLKQIEKWDKAISKQVARSSYSLKNSILFQLVIKFGNLLFFPALVLIIVVIYQIDLFRTGQFIFGIGLVTGLLLLIKPIIGRKKPNDQNHSGIFSYYKNFSFPSGHATRMGVLAVFIGVYYLMPIYNSGIIISWALVVSFSRIILEEHYFSDVFVGFLLGAGVMGIIRICSIYLLSIN